jgi:hypothetical protein
MDEASLIAGLEFMPLRDSVTPIRYARSVSDLFKSEVAPHLNWARPAGSLNMKSPMSPSTRTASWRSVHEVGRASERPQRVQGQHLRCALAKPVDRGLIRSLFDRNIPIITIEDHSSTSGFGSCVVEAILEMNLCVSSRMGLPGVDLPG